MRIFAPLIACGALLCANGIRAQDMRIVGTWTTKSMKVLTGPGFYNPVDDKFIEPELTGISYSFTQDGWFEEAYYRAIPNPTNPNCPSGMMQWQHGTYELPGNGSIILHPIEVDGRQLISTPCQYDNSLYIRWSNTELIKSYGWEIDKFHNVERLNLFKFDGSPQQPLYLNMRPPQMLPTQTLNPTATPSATKSSSKRDLDPQVAMKVGEPLNKHALDQERNSLDPDSFWWMGVGFIAVGSAMYFYPTGK